MDTIVAALASAAVVAVALIGWGLWTVLLRRWRLRQYHKGHRPSPR